MRKNYSSSRCQASLRPAPQLHASSSSFIWQKSLIIIVITIIIIIIHFWTSADTIYIHISAQHCCLRSEPPDFPYCTSVLCAAPARQESQIIHIVLGRRLGQEGGSVPFPFLLLFLLKILVEQIQRGVWEQPGSEGMGGPPTASGREKPKICLLIFFFFFNSLFLLFSFFFLILLFVLLFQGGGGQR